MSYSSLKNSGKFDAEPFFDDFGRCVAGVVGAEKWLCERNKKRLVDEPQEFDYSQITNRFTEYFSGRNRFFSADDFENVAESFRERKMGESSSAAAFFKRAWPIQIPKYSVGNMGWAVEKFILPAVRRSFEDRLSGKIFINYCNSLNGDIAVVEGVGHKELLSRIKKEPLVAWYSPDSLQEVPINEQRKVIQSLRKSDNFSLAGVFETSSAIVSYTSEMTSEEKEGSFDCSANMRVSDKWSFAFNVREDRLDFLPIKYTDIGFLGCSGGILLWE